MERKLASIQRILDIQPIEGADKIVKATINGWQLVTAIDNGFKVGDLVIYFEIDSWIPTEIAPFLSKGKEPRMFDNVAGERLKTIRLRGEVSQGLIIPIPEEFNDPTQFGEGFDLTEQLGILKYEKPLPANLTGMARGNFPSFIQKTDQERIQNSRKEMTLYVKNKTEFEVTEKIDGSSMTVYSKVNDDGEKIIGVCSRNLDLKLDQEGNSFVNIANKCGIITALMNSDKEVAVQGELYGEGIQGNPQGIAGHKFAIFDIFDIKKQVYMPRKEKMEFFTNSIMPFVDLNLCRHIPVIYENFVMETEDIGFYLKMAEGKIGNSNVEREGLVFKSLDGEYSFKAISNKFLISEKD
jgi:RNA ligase (TIGR02306 family)